MSFIQQPAYIITVLLILIVFSEWLCKKNFFRHIGSVLIVILLAAILANLGSIPSSGNAPALYDGIFSYAAPLGIFYLLLDVRLKDLKLAGLPMMIMFLVGSLGTMVGAVAGYHIFSPQNHFHYAAPIAGMYTGTYIGGGANLNAIALHYGVTKDGALFAAVNTVDNICTTIWLMATLILPRIFQKLFPHKRTIPPSMANLSDEEIREKTMQGLVQISLIDVALLLALGMGTLFISNYLTSKVPEIPSILTLTTIALVLAQLPFVQRLKGGKIIGYLLIMIFLAVVGAFCDLTMLAKSGDIAGILLIWVTVLILIHALILFVVGGIFKQDWDIVAIASNANIGGATSAPVLAASLGRPDLQLPGILAGSVGNAIGTYLGILVAEFLK